MFGQVGVFFGWDLPVNHISFNDPAAEININRQIEHFKHFSLVTHYDRDNLNIKTLFLIKNIYNSTFCTFNKRSEANQK